MVTRENRNTLAEVLIGALTAVAFEEMVRAVHESVAHNGFAVKTLALPVIFALTTIRFLMGNLLHLIKDPPRNGEATNDGLAWFGDLMVIVVLATVLAFLGGLTAGEESVKLNFSFFDVLCVVYVIDALWIILALWIRGREVPWGWLILDVAMLLATLVIYGCLGGAAAYSEIGLAVFVIANAAAFGFDVWLQRKYGLI